MSSTFMGFASLSEAFQTNTEAINEEQDALKKRSEAYTALDLAKVSEDTEAIAKATENLAEAELAVAGATKKRAETTTIGAFQAQIAAAKKFGENIKHLMGTGAMTQPALAQLLSLGPVAGAQVTDEMITTGSFWSFQHSMNELAGISSDLGLASANLFMGGSLASAQANAAAVNQYSITVNAGLVSNPAQVGRDIIEAIKNAERVSGQVFVSV